MFQLINLLMRMHTINDGHYARSGHATARLMHIHIKGMPEVYSSRICQHLEGFLSQ
jgi:hypothetical protein